MMKLKPLLNAHVDSKDFATLKDLAKKMQSDSWLHPAAQRAMDLVFSVEVIWKNEERKQKIERQQKIRDPKIIIQPGRVKKINKIRIL